MSAVRESTGIRVAPEWAAHRAIWTAWPSHPELWLDNLEPARDELARMIHLLADGDRINVLACGESALASAQAQVGAKARVFPATFGDIWVRDTGPIIAHGPQGPVAVRFRTNGWGGKYDLPGDEEVGDEIACLAGLEISRHDAVLEGGALEHNGEGWILTTRQCLLNPNRNPGWNESRAEQLLARALGCTRVLWLDDGLLNDHTDGHIDNLARFVGPRRLVCQAPSGEDDPNAAVYQATISKLTAYGLQVNTIPSPGRVTDGDGHVVPASHMNFIIGNARVVMPTYDTPSAADAVIALQKLFPDHEVVGSPSSALLTGGGSFHCITQQEPAQ